jgi:hypothetical protein
MPDIVAAPKRCRAFAIPPQRLRWRDESQVTTILRPTGHAATNFLQRNNFQGCSSNSIDA